MEDHDNTDVQHNKGITISSSATISAKQKTTCNLLGESDAATKLS